MPDQPDEWLMVRVAKDQGDSLEPLLRRHADKLLNFIGRMTGPGGHCEELFQEVFLAVWNKRKQYRYPQPFRAWLYAIALNPHFSYGVDLGSQ